MRSLVVICLAGIGCGRSDFDPLRDANDARSPRSGCTTQIASRGDQICALRDDHTVWCWGNNSKGNLGNGLLAASSIPVQVQISDVVQLSGGEDTTCARTSRNELYCWGANDAGQIGDGTGMNQPIPQRILGLPPIVAMANGEWHTCVAGDDGSVWCWGSNLNGELGDGGTMPSGSPVLAFATHPMELAISDHVTCARKGGGVECWGRGDYGELGDGTFTAVQPMPVPVMNLSNVTSLRGGCHRHMCALTGDGEVKCWGDGEYGELGDGMLGFSHQSNLALTVQTLPVASVEISVGAWLTCARGVDNHVRCWGGEPGSPNLGNGTLGGSLAPVEVDTIDDAIAIELQCQGGCVIRGDHTVWCWGANVGNGTTNASSPLRANVPCD